MRIKSCRYRDLASLASLDKNILTNVCGLNRCNSTTSSESDTSSHCSRRKHRTDNKRTYFESKHKACHKEQNYWNHDNCPNNSTSSYYSSDSRSICSVCSGYIYSDSASYSRSESGYSSSDPSECNGLCQRCIKELKNDESSSDSSFRYDSIYTSECRSSVDDLRNFYSTSLSKCKEKRSKNKSKGCGCSEDECLHELLGDEVSDLTRIIERCNYGNKNRKSNEKGQDTITILLANVIVYMQRLLKDIKIQIPDTANVIRLTISYLILYWLGLF